MNTLFKKLMHLLFGNYELYRIFKNHHLDSTKITVDLPVSVDLLTDKMLCLKSDFVEIRDMATFFNEDKSLIYGLWLNQTLVCVCVFYCGEFYNKKRGFIVLKNNEAKLVEIVCAKEARGQGLATYLINYASKQMISKGYKNVYARIWHNNYASVNAFKKAGWIQIAFIVIIYPFNYFGPFRLQIKALPKNEIPIDPKG